MCRIKSQHRDEVQKGLKETKPARSKGVGGSEGSSGWVTKAGSHTLNTMVVAQWQKMAFSAKCEPL